MHNELPYRLLADAVLALHFAVVVFVIGGLVMIVIGKLRHWQWVNAWTFRLAHMATAGLVVVESWLGAVCPLTTFEMWLRVQAQASSYSGSFIEHWLQRLLYYDVPSWVFMLVYSLFYLLVVAAWMYFPPGSRTHSNDKPENAD